MRQAIAVILASAVVATPLLWLSPAVQAAVGVGPIGLLGITGFAAGSAAAMSPLAELLRPRRSSLTLYEGALILGMFAAGLIVGGGAALFASVSPLSSALVVAMLIGWTSDGIGVFDTFKDLGRPAALFKVRQRGDRRYLEIMPEQLGKPLLFSATIERGLGEKDFFSSRNYDLEFLWVFRKVGDHIELAAKNTKYRAEPGTPLEKMIEQSIPDSAVLHARIVKTNPATGAITVSLDDLLLQDVFDFAAQLKQAYDRTYQLNENLSHLRDVKTYPENIEIRSDVYFTDAGQSDGDASSHLRDTRHLPMTMRYSLSALPADGFRPRRADDRIGTFTVPYQDWSDDQRPDQDEELVTRWRLEKADPSSPLSPPKKPIVFWLDPAIPKEYRAGITKGVLAWNEAFEAIGFKDAVEVKDVERDMSPEERAAFDPSDARYNVIRYYLEQDSAFAIAPSRVNPLTGEIYNATIAISAKHVRRALGLEAKGYNEFDGIGAGRKEDCSSGGCRHAAEASGEASMILELLKARKQLEGDGRARFIEAYFTELAMHEAGHALGLRHNFKAKTYRSPEQLADAELAANSVMDYLAYNLALPGEKQGPLMMTRIGPYDKWAIRYAYSTFESKSPDEIDLGLAKIASESAKPEHAYATDEDNDAELDPSIQWMSLSNDTLDHSRRRMALTREYWDHLEVRPPAAGEGFDLLSRGFRQSLQYYQLAVRLASHYVGGMYFNRHHATDPGAKPAFEVVPAAKQREALALLAEEVFSDRPFHWSASLLRKLPPARKASVDDPYPILRPLSADEVVLTLRETALNRLLDPRVLSRLVSSRRYVPDGEEVFNLEDLLHELDRTIWSELPAKIPKNAKGRSRKKISVSISPMRRQLQEQYLNRLIDIGYLNSKRELPVVTTTVRAHLSKLMDRLDQLGKSRAIVWGSGAKEQVDQSYTKILSAIDYYQPVTEPEE